MTNSTSKLGDVIVSSPFRVNGEKRYRRTRVGAAFHNKNIDGGIDLLLNPGISISSLEGVRISILPPKPESDDATDE